MALAADSESHPPVNLEHGAVGSSVPTPEKGEEAPIPRRRPTSDGEVGEVEDPIARDRATRNLEKEDGVVEEEEEGAIARDLVIQELKEVDRKEGEGAAIAGDCVIVELKENEGKEGEHDAVVRAASAPAPEGSEEDDQVPVASDVVFPDMDEEHGVILVAGESPTWVKEGTVAEPSKIITLQDEDVGAEEMAQTFFTCSICMDLLYKPTVIACGHMLCVGCTYKHSTIELVGNPICPVCKIPYSNLPRLCELIGGLVLKLQPSEGEPAETKETGSSSMKELGEVKSQKIQLKDVICDSCKDMLFEPLVLQCGHVFCKSCAMSADGIALKCKTCGALHPGAPPSLCWEFKNFLEVYFPSEYKSRTHKIQSSSGTSSVGEYKIPDAKLSETHVGVGCDSCRVYPIRGNWYSCKTCEDFDLCENCSSTDSTIHGLSGQVHSRDHVVELNDSFLFGKVLIVLDKKGQNVEDDDSEGEVEDDDSEGEVEEWQQDFAGLNDGFQWRGL